MTVLELKRKKIANNSQPPTPLIYENKIIPRMNSPPKGKMHHGKFYEN